jgi:hypothetical protein
MTPIALIIMILITVHIIAIGIWVMDLVMVVISDTLLIINHITVPGTGDTQVFIITMPGDTTAIMQATIMDIAMVITTGMLIITTIIV